MDLGDSRVQWSIRLALAGGVLLLALYAWGIEPYWVEVTRHRVAAPLEQPLTIAHVTDLHTRGFGRLERRLVEILENERPDVVLVTGDTVPEGETSHAAAVEVLGRLRAPLGIWAVGGNWDHIGGSRDLYEAQGVRVLSDEARELRPGVWLAGLDDMHFGADPEAASRDIPPGAFVVALLHSPAFFDAVAGRWPLALAGHTHGGQVRLPFWGPLWLPQGSGQYEAGWYESGDSKLYVSRGLGTSILPIRFLCRPELALITLEPLGGQTATLGMNGRSGE